MELVPVAQKHDCEGPRGACFAVFAACVSLWSQHARGRDVPPGAIGTPKKTWYPKVECPPQKVRPGAPRSIEKLRTAHAFDFLDDVDPVWRIVVPPIIGCYTQQSPRSVPLTMPECGSHRDRSSHALLRESGLRRHRDPCVRVGGGGSVHVATVLPCPLAYLLGVVASTIAASSLSALMCCALIRRRAWAVAMLGPLGPAPLTPYIESHIRHPVPIVNRFFVRKGAGRTL